MATLVMENCGTAAEAVLSPLPPQRQAAALKDLTWRMLNAYCATSQESGEFTVSVTYTPSKPPQLRDGLTYPLAT